MFGITGAGTPGPSIKEIADNRLPRLVDLLTLEEVRVLIDSAENALLATTMDAATRKEKLASFGASKAELDAAWQDDEPLSPTTEEARVWTQFVAAFDTWWTGHLEFVRREAVDEKALAGGGDVAGTYAAMAHQGLVGMITGFILALGLGIMPSGAITRPLVRGIAFAQAVAAGDVTRRLGVDQRDEVGMPASALTNVSEMSQNISAATGEQTTNARQVSKAIEKVNDITQTAASAAQLTSAATEQLALMAQFTVSASSSASPVGEPGTSRAA